MAMKNQYYGDINDYRKYGLLRLCIDAGWRVGECWMLTPDDGGVDGRKTSYLADPRRWRVHDSSLFDALLPVLSSQINRSVICAEEPNLLPGAAFYGEPVPARDAARRVWCDRSLSSLA